MQNFSETIEISRDLDRVWRNFDFDETYTLVEKGSSSTQLTVALSLTSDVFVVGGWIEREIGRPLARLTVRTSLEAIKPHCEGR